MNQWQRNKENRTVTVWPFQLKCAAFQAPASRGVAWPLKGERGWVPPGCLASPRVGAAGHGRHRRHTTWTQAASPALCRPEFQGGKWWGQFSRSNVFKNLLESDKFSFFCSSSESLLRSWEWWDHKTRVAFPKFLPHGALWEVASYRLSLSGVQGPGSCLQPSKPGRGRSSDLPFRPTPHSLFSCLHVASSSNPSGLNFLTYKVETNITSYMLLSFCENEKQWCLREDTLPAADPASPRRLRTSRSTAFFVPLQTAWAWDPARPPVLLLSCLFDFSFSGEAVPRTTHTFFWLIFSFGQSNLQFPNYNL